MDAPNKSRPVPSGSNGIVRALLTDLYQITMAYAYWKNGKNDNHSIFDLFFRKNPFNGEFTIFAGLAECVKFLEGFHFSECDIDYLRNVLPASTDPEFFEYMRNVTAEKVTLQSVPEGDVVFPKVPLMTLSGPLAIVQLLETTLLNLVNYASLVATNAARFRLAAGPDIALLEFGLRRAQGPDGGLSASRYCYMGGFDGTSNVLAGKMFGIPVKGTHAHAFITSFVNMQEIDNRMLKSKDGSTEANFVDLCYQYQAKLTKVLNFIPDQVNEGELSAFVAYALAFPDNFLALIDTYDVVRSGLPNFCTVALALSDLGYQALGIRLDSGDLAYLSKEVGKSFSTLASAFNQPWWEKLTIVASNDINEDTILSLKQQGHAINCYGIGTHLVTCQRQPALGCVFKLVEVNQQARMKLSEDMEKMTIPGMKSIYRLYGADGTSLADLMQMTDEPPPCAGKRVLCRHPYHETKRAFVNPASIKCLHKTYWKDGKITEQLPTLSELREYTQKCLESLRQDHKRTLNPTPYKVSVSKNLYDFIHQLWLDSAPIGELS